MVVNLVAALWGFAEASVFFIVPDVFTGAVALGNPRKAMATCLWAAGGALLGATALALWAHQNLGSAYRMLDDIPGIDAALIAEAGASLDTQGNLALFQAPFEGIPYKILVVQAVARDGLTMAFLGASLLARLGRFFLVTALSAILGRTLLRRLSLPARLIVYVALWGIFYQQYFQVMGL